MGKIEILNKHHLKECDPTHIYIGRGSPLGNPYPVKEYSRETAIALYGPWLKRQLFDKNEAVIDALDDIANRVMAGETVKLLCFCKPLHCHGDVIKKLVCEAIQNG